MRTSASSPEEAETAMTSLVGPDGQGRESKLLIDTGANPATSSCGSTLGRQLNTA